MLCVACRSCPECRVVSEFVIPSIYWVEDQDEKNRLIEEFKSGVRWEAIAGVTVVSADLKCKKVQAQKATFNVEIVPVLNGLFSYTLVRWGESDMVIIYRLK